MDGERQGELFPASELRGSREGDGYRGPTACQIVGITYRQLDYWARTGLVVPTMCDAQGSGSKRLYSFTDVLVLKIVKRLLDAGISLQNIRCAVEHLRAHGVRDLAGITLLSDGVTIYECRSPEEVVDLLQGGQGVFAITLDAALRELTGAIRAFPPESSSRQPTLIGLPSRRDTHTTIWAAS